MTRYSLCWSSFLLWSWSSTFSRLWFAHSSTKRAMWESQHGWTRSLQRRKDELNDHSVTVRPSVYDVWINFGWKRPLGEFLCQSECSSVGRCTRANPKHHTRAVQIGEVRAPARVEQRQLRWSQVCPEHTRLSSLLKTVFLRLTEVRPWEINRKGGIWRCVFQSPKVQLHVYP